MNDTTELRVHESNADQLRAWDGAEGEFWTRHADRYDAAVAGYHQRLLAAAEVRPVEMVLDIGCGTGQLTRDAARLAVDGGAVGIDLSASMIAEARRRAVSAGVRNARFEQADAQIHRFPAAAYDLVVSRTGTMFFGSPGEAFANIVRAVRPGGRLALAVWQPLTENEWFTAFGTALAAGRDLPAPPAGAPGPFAMSDPAVVRRLLTEAGLAEVELDDVREPMSFGASAHEAHAFVLGQLGWLVADLPADARTAAERRLLRTLEDHQDEQAVRFGSAMWVVRARRP